MKKSILSLLLAIIVCLTGCTGIPETQPPAIEEATSDLKVHFIDVGQADASLIISGDEAMLIDGGNVDDSSRIVAYLKKHDINHLDYIVCTHAHEDHVGGLSGALATTTVDTVYAPKTEEDTKAYLNFAEKVSERGRSITNPNHGESFTLGGADVMFVGPISEDTDDLNNTSIVLKITYGDTSFLFTGDAERDEETEIINAGYDISADVLKVAHHGSGGSSSYPFLREVMPNYAIISVGKDNPYNHPSDDAISRLEDAGAKIYRTDLLGDIVAVSDGKNITISNAKNDDSKTDTQITDDTEIYSGGYIGNKSSKKYHNPNCSSLPAEKNRVYFSSKEEAESQNYTPCKSCN